MTTEIAVSNKIGIALATDSAVTIEGGGRVKVFNTADKLFELSNNFPVGVMVNGNMDCLGVPWELLVKGFREKEGMKPRATVEDWRKDFLIFVEGHTLISEETIGGYIDRVIETEIDAVQWGVRDFINDKFFHDGSHTNRRFKTPKLNIIELLAEVIKQRKEFLEQFERAESLSELDPVNIKEKYKDRIEERMKTRFKGQTLTPEELSSLTDLVVEALLRSLDSPHTTGIVVAGYGETQMFPAVSAVEVDGRILGRLKIKTGEKTDIMTSATGGEVTYFAQTDVIERLLKGVDPLFVEMSADFLKRSLIDVATVIEQSQRPKRISKKAIADRLKKIEEVAQTVTDEYTTKTSEEMKNNLAREFDKMIAMMPKQELIELAEALVSITAVERKATVDEGTVGGPIDVAFITKHEGFVWIKRKHYFDGQRNPRYFWRKFGNPPAKQTSTP
jgi:hypothetical protein